MLTLSALRYLYEQDQQLSAEAKKVLGFSDNRQDAALQAGHFNDFLQVLLTRAALLSATQKAGGNALTEREVANAVFEALGFHRDDPAVRAEYMQQPELKGNTRRQVQEAMRGILGYRTYFDLRRGWRFNNPNLEQLGLVRINYQDLNDLAADASEWAEAPQVLQVARPEERAKVLRELFDFMRQGLCIATRYLDRTELDQLRTQSYANLREPWGFTEDERPVPARWFVTSRPKEEADRRGRRVNLDDFLVIGSSRSRLGRELRKGSTWGGGNPYYKAINDQTWSDVVGALLKAAESYGLVRKEETDVGLTGWQLNGTALLWELGDGQSQRQAEDNAFFRALYRNIAVLLDSPVHQLFDFEAREHTAQVEQDDRLEREARFRFTEKDRDEWRKKNGTELEWLPVLFCSPTMELGVDISSLNTVYMRNVPPTPANYAQRSGRAGRAGQPALVITYCASQSPHDQYYFRDPVRMVHGQVNAPTLDLANLELVKSHMHAIWLAETGRGAGGQEPVAVVELAEVATVHPMAVWPDIWEQTPVTLRTHALDIVHESERQDVRVHRHQSSGLPRLDRVRQRLFFLLCRDFLRRLVILARGQPQDHHPVAHEYLGRAQLCQLAHASAGRVTQDGEPIRGLARTAGWAVALGMNRTGEQRHQLFLTQVKFIHPVASAYLGFAEVFKRVLMAPGFKHIVVRQRRNRRHQPKMLIDRLRPHRLLAVRLARQLAGLKPHQVFARQGAQTGLAAEVLQPLPHRANLAGGLRAGLALANPIIKRAPHVIQVML